jgi:putative hemolysin
VTLETTLLLLLPPLLLASGFFSCSETALFGMGENDRMRLRRRARRANAAADRLLAEPRMLLISLLLGNVTINILYLVIGSVLLLRWSDEGPWFVEAAIAAGTLLGLVVFGEILPKLVGETHRIAAASLLAPPLLLVHRALAPIRLPLARFVVDPLARLTAPSAAPPRLTEAELGQLLESSAREGLIALHEQELLLDVLRLQRLRVRDVHVPRVRVAALPIDATPAMVREVVRRERLSRLPVHRGGLDQVAGILPVKRYLALGDAARIEPLLQPPLFVPEIASVEALLVHFRESGATLAITVDEFGGTAGVVALEDVVEAIVGEIPAPGEVLLPPPLRLDAATWRVSGEMSIHEWASAFRIPLAGRWASTVGGLLMERLGRPVAAGDRVRLGNVELEAETIDGAVVRTALVRLVDAENRAPSTAALPETGGGR